jgi:5-hydroxyisourate hydrolase
MSLSTHVLDASIGLPATGVAITLDVLDGDTWRGLATATTDSDGRVAEFGSPSAAVHRLTFDTESYFAGRGIATFYPHVSVVFAITDPNTHHHVPLLLSPFAYSTYRGS